MRSEKVNNILDVVKRNFETDNDLLNIYHIDAPSTADKCAERTARDLKDTQADFCFYVLTDGNNEVGFYGTESCKTEKFLTSFFIRPEYRKESFIKDFWDNVKSSIGDTAYYTGVYTKNTRAINFLKKKGKIIMSGTNKEGNDYVVFELNHLN